MTHSDPYCVKYFSWKPVVVGALVAFGLIFLFSLLTVGGGLASYTKTQEGLETLVFLSYLWAVVGGFLMLFIAGLITSMILSHKDMEHHDACNSMLHGFVMWVVYILITIFVLAQIPDKTVIGLPQNFLAPAADTTVAKVAKDIGKATENVVKNDSEKVNEKIPAAEQKAAHQVGIATLATFFVFFVEALAAMFGAYCGRDFCEKREYYRRRDLETKKLV